MLVILVDVRLEEEVGEDVELVGDDGEEFGFVVPFERRLERSGERRLARERPDEVVEPPDAGAMLRVAEELAPEV